MGRHQRNREAAKTESVEAENSFVTAEAFAEESGLSVGAVIRRTISQGGRERVWNTIGAAAGKTYYKKSWLTSLFV